MRTLLTLTLAGGLIGVAAAAAGVALTRPAGLPPGTLDGLEGDAARGAAVFWAAGCASCHAEPRAEGEARLVLAGGYRIESPFGTFVAPNISPHPDAGIGDWSTRDFVTALLHGTSPEGLHYYPAFPYASYARMTPADAVDLKAFIDTLPPDPRPSAPHELSFPYSLRAGIGLWKALNLDTAPVIAVEGAELERGRYIVEALAHCGECHTPRDALGGLDLARWMAGAPNPSGEGRIPGITPAQLDWTAEDIAYYLETGFTPEFDSAGGTMGSVVRNFARLTPEDRAAVAAYVKALPPAE
jgi:mono/diheme cytochrome c family protein